MPMDTPVWADAELSLELPALRSRGEGQDLEYKREFPGNANALLKEIAAFATSAGGLLLIGITDGGALEGLPDCVSASARSELVRRIEGLGQSVRPAIVPTVRFAVEDGKVVLAVTVPHGRHPVYYANNVPYIRHLTQSRPATPEEVYERIIAHYQAQNASSRANNHFLSEVANALIVVLMYADEYEDRQANPWFDAWRAEYAFVAANLRKLAASQEAVNRGVGDELKKIAQAIDRAATLRVYSGAGDALTRATEDAGRKALSFFKEYIEPIPVGSEAKKQAHDDLAGLLRQLVDLHERAFLMIDNAETEQLQSEVAQIGSLFIKLSHYKIGLGAGNEMKLRNLGKELHLLETRRLYDDGGQSEQAIVDGIAEGCRKGRELLLTIENAT